MSMNVGELFGTLTLDTSEWDKNISAATSALDKLAVGIAAAATAAAGLGLKFSAELEVAEVSFTTLLGSAEAAKTMMEDLKQFAATTPFQFQDLATSAKVLTSVGFEAEKVLPMLQGIGDAVAGMGGNGRDMAEVATQLGKMAGQGRVSAEVMESLQLRAGFGFKQLAESMGLTVAEVRKMSEQGLISSADGLNAFFEHTQSSMGGMMAALSRTFSGLVSTLRDTVLFQLSDMMTPVREDLASTLPAIMEFSGTFIRAIGPVVTTALKAFTGALRLAVNIFNMLPGPVQAVVSNLVALDLGLAVVTSAAIATAPAMMGVYAAAAKTIPVAIDVGTAFAASATKAWAFATSLEGLNLILFEIPLKLKALAIPLAAVVAGIAGVILIIGSLRLVLDEMGLTFSDVFDGAVATFKRFANDASDVLKNIFGGMGRYVSAAVDQWDEFLTGVRDNFYALLVLTKQMSLDEFNRKTAQSVFADVGDFVDFGIEMGGYFVEGLANSARDIKDRVGAAMGAGIDTVLDAIPDGLREAVEEALKGVELDFGDGAAAAGGGGGGGVAAAVADWGHSLTSDIAGWGGQAALELYTASENVAEAVEEVAFTLSDFAHEIAGQVASDAGLGGIIGNAQMGAAAGPLGAAAGAVFGLIQMSDQYAAVMEGFRGALQTLANIVGTLIAPLEGVGRSLSRMFDAIAPLLVPILEAIAEPLDTMAKQFQVMAHLLEMIGPFIEGISKAFDALTGPLKGLDIGARALFEVMRVVGLMILGIVWGLGSLWNGIIGVLDSVFETFGKIVGKVFPKLEDDLAGLFDGLKVNLDGVNDSLKNLMNTNYAAATAGEESASGVRYVGTTSYAAAESIRQLNESISNIPQGFKVAAARFQAMDADMGGGSYSVGVGGGVTINGNVYIEALADAAEVAEVLEDRLLVTASRETGMPVSRFSPFS